MTASVELLAPEHEQLCYTIGTLLVRKRVSSLGSSPEGVAKHSVRPGSLQFRRLGLPRSDLRFISVFREIRG
jgi:hypothetical protein